MVTTGRACNARRARAAFTLLEVVIAMAILVMVLMICYQILGSTLEASDQIDRKTRPDKIGDAIMGAIRRDLQGVVWYGRGEDVFRGDDGGVGETARDEVHFFTTTRPVAMVQGRLGNEQWWTGVTSVSYVLHQSREVDGCYVLLRRESTEIAENPFETGTYFELYGKMKFLDILYFDGYEWVEAWDSLERIEYYRAEVQLLSEEAAAEASSVTTRTRDAGAAATPGATAAPSGAAARDAATTAGVAARGADVAGETLAQTPLPERGIPRAIRVTFGLLAGAERGLFKEGAAPDAMEKVYTFSATINLPAATSTRITADVAALTPPAAAAGGAVTAGKSGPLTVGGAAGGAGKAPDGKRSSGKGREDLLRILDGMKKAPSSGGARPASGGARPASGGATKAPKRMPGQKK